MYFAEEFKTSFRMIYSKLNDGIHDLDQWLFHADEDSQSDLSPGFLIVLSLNKPLTAGIEEFDWFTFSDQESAGGTAGGSLKGKYALTLNVTKEVLDCVLAQTHLSKEIEPGTGWRHDLSWHDTKIDNQNDPTVSSCLRASAQLGLTWTGPTDLASCRYGIKLAQAAYPFDATDTNLRMLGITDSIQRLLGEPANAELHSILLLTPNND